MRDMFDNKLIIFFLFSQNTMVFALSKCVSIQKRKFQTSLTGLEPARQYGNSVLNYLLNHSDTTTRYVTVENS